MKGKRKSLVLLLIILLSTQFLISIYAQPEESSPVYVNSYIPFVDNDLVEGSGERVLWSNYTNLFYIFTHMDYHVMQHSVSHAIIGYAYSPDGINFIVVDDFFEEISTHAGSTRGNFDVALSPDNRYVWFAWKHELGTYDSIYVVKCELLLDGSINPLTTEQLVASGVTGVDHVEGYIDIEVSSLGYPFVAFCTHQTMPYIAYFAYVRWSNYDNGTWIQSGEDSFDPLLTWNKNDEYIEFSKLLRLEDGKMAWACDFADSIANSLWKLYVGWFDGTTWIEDSASGLYGDLASTSIHGYKRTDITSYRDMVIGTYVRREASNQKWWVKSALYNTEFTNSTLIVGTYPELTGHRVPNIVTTYDGNIITTIFEEGTESVNYTYRYSNYTWGPLLLPNLKRWYGNNSQVFNWDQFTCAERFDNFLGFTYHDNSYADMEILFDYMSFNGTMLPEYMVHYNTTLYNSDGSINDGWIFRGETYKFISFFKGASTFELNFTDGEHDIHLSYNNETQQLSVYSDDQFIIGDYYYNISQFLDGTTKAIWGFIPNTNIVDIENTTVNYYLYNEILDSTINGSTGITFNIYNLGGYTYYTFVGDGGRTPYKSPFSLYATDGNLSSSAKAEQIFRKLQHISFLIEIDMHNEWEAVNGEFDIADVAGFGYVNIGIDYRLNGSWVDGFKIKLYVQDADVGHHDAGVDHDWVEWSVDFYNYDPSSGFQQNLESQLIYSNHWGYDHENYVPDHHINRTSCQFWVDLWFDKTNASTTIASQVNAYYYGVKEQGSSFWFGYGVFVPMISDYDNAKYLDDLYDETGNITNCQKFDLMKFYIEVGKVNDTLSDANDEKWEIRAIEDMHREQATDRMEGIDEPTFVQTKVMDMPQTGFINALKSALGNIANSIMQGIFFTLKSLWAGVGWIAELMGLKKWYDALSMMLGKIATASLNFMDSLELALINSALLLEQIIRLVSTGLTKYTTLITAFITNILKWYGHIVDMFTGGGIWNIDIWMSLSLEDWFTLALNLLPVWWAIRLSKADDIIRTIQGDLSFVIQLVTGVYWFLTTIIFLTVELLTFLIGLLPI